MLFRSNNLPVVFAIDRAGIVGSDGETHQGIFDLSYLTHMPNMTVMAPKNKYELRKMIYFATNLGRPVAIRYPRGTAYEGLGEFKQAIEYGKGEVIYDEKKGEVLLIALGSMVETSIKVRDMLQNHGISASVINARFASPIDKKLLDEFSSKCNLWVTLEENVKTGGFGESVSSFITDNNYNNIHLINISVPDCFIEHGDVDKLKENIGLDALSIYNKIRSNLKNKDSYSSEFRGL